MTKVDETTLATSRRKFAHVCVEINLDKPLVTSYRMRGRDGRLQYEGLQDLCFTCCKYGHKEIKFPRTTSKISGALENEGSAASDMVESDQGAAWMVAQKTHCCHRGGKRVIRVLTTIWWRETQGTIMVNL